jgi:uncharacterized cupin superfamily protein
VIDALTVVLEHGPLPADQVISGSPTTGSLVLDERAGREIGVWEMTPGVATDIELDEVFVVLAGSATVEGVEDAPIELGPGSTVTLTAGMRTTWTVRETLRKIYVI